MEVIGKVPMISDMIESKRIDQMKISILYELIGMVAPILVLADGNNVTSILSRLRALDPAAFDTAINADTKADTDEPIHLGHIDISDKSKPVKDTTEVCNINIWCKTFSEVEKLLVSAWHTYISNTSVKLIPLLEFIDVLAKDKSYPQHFLAKRYLEFVKQRYISNT